MRQIGPAGGAQGGGPGGAGQQQQGGNMQQQQQQHQVLYKTFTGLFLQKESNTSALILLKILN